MTPEELAAENEALMKQFQEEDRLEEWPSWKKQGCFGWIEKYALMGILHGAGRPKGCQ